MKIFAFAGSNSSNSINKRLVGFALEYFTNDEINLIDLNDYEMPIFSIDREKLGYPEEAIRFLEDIQNCDLIICSLAENNRTFSVAFKNVLDWCSRINSKVFQNKKMFLMTTSTGELGGEKSMTFAKYLFPRFGAEIVESFSLPSFYENFGEENSIINSDLLNEFNQKIKHVKLAF